MIQQWLCEPCGRNGSAELPAGCDFWQGIALVRAAHAKASPDCPAPPTGIRVRNPYLCSAEQWAQRCRFLATEAERRRAAHTLAPELNGATEDK